MNFVPKTQAELDAIDTLIFSTARGLMTEKQMNVALVAGLVMLSEHTAPEYEAILLKLGDTLEATGINLDDRYVLSDPETPNA